MKFGKENLKIITPVIITERGSLMKFQWKQIDASVRPLSLIPLPPSATIQFIISQTEAEGIRETDIRTIPAFSSHDSGRVFGSLLLLSFREQINILAGWVSSHGNELSLISNKSSRLYGTADGDAGGSSRKYTAENTIGQVQVEKLRDHVEEVLEQKFQRYVRTSKEPLVQPYPFSFYFLPPS